MFSIVGENVINTLTYLKHTMIAVIENFINLSALIALITSLMFIFLFLGYKFLPQKQSRKINLFFKNISPYSLWGAFIVSLFATLSSLFYSEIMGFNPCPLCWYQRIFMYVLPIITFVAIIRKDKNVFYYIAPLSVIGMFIAAYHYGVQIRDSLICSGALDCSFIYNLSYGFMTIPVMAFSGFLLTFILVFLHKRFFKR